MNFTRIVRNCIPRNLRNWLRHPTRSANYLIGKFRHRVLGSESVVLAEDWIVKCHPLSREHFFVFTNDKPQIRELDLFRHNCPEGIRLLDIGAHHGFFALAATRFGGPTAKILCVEASPSASSILKTNLSLNSISNQVTVMNVAAGATDGTLSMLTTGPAAGDYYLVPSETRPDTIEVPQLSLASIIQHSEFSPSHIKIDIEGFEYELIEAAIPLLRNLKPIIFLELHGDALRARNLNPSDVVQFLRAAGYHHFQLEDSDLSLEEMDLHDFNCRMICRP